jgi:hypothetical protein
MTNKFSAALGAIECHPYGTHVNGGIEILILNETIREALLTAQKVNDQWQQLADFHFDTRSDLPEKANLYLTGISALGVQFMQDTDATRFTVSSELPHKKTGKRYKAVYTLEEIS